MRSPLGGEEFKATGALSNGSLLVCPCETPQPPSWKALLVHGRARAGREGQACRSTPNPTAALIAINPQGHLGSVDNSAAGWKFEGFAFSVTDVYGLRDRSCCPYVDVTLGKGRLGDNRPRATPPEFVQVSLVCNAGP